MDWIKDIENYALTVIKEIHTIIAVKTIENE